MDPLSTIEDKLEQLQCVQDSLRFRNLAFLCEDFEALMKFKDIQKINKRKADRIAIFKRMISNFSVFHHADLVTCLILNPLNCFMKDNFHYKLMEKDAHFIDNGMVYYYRLENGKLFDYSFLSNTTYIKRYNPPFDKTQFDAYLEQIHKNFEVNFDIALDVIRLANDKNNRFHPRCWHIIGDAWPYLKEYMEILRELDNHEMWKRVISFLPNNRHLIDLSEIILEKKLHDSGYVQLNSEAWEILKEDQKPSEMVPPGFESDNKELEIVLAQIQICNSCSFTTIEMDLEDRLELENYTKNLLNQLVLYYCKAKKVQHVQSFYPLLGIWFKSKDLSYQSNKVDDAHVLTNSELAGFLLGLICPHYNPILICRGSGDA